MGLLLGIELALRGQPKSWDLLPRLQELQPAVVHSMLCPGACAHGEPSPSLSLSRRGHDPPESGLKVRLDT